METEMTFTDDRLRILKNIELKQTAQIVWSHSEIEALLARLEDSEAYSKSLKFCLTRKCNPWPCKDAIEKEKAWRKSKGEK